MVDECWYAARMIIEVEHPDGLEDPCHEFFEDRIVILTASSDQEAEEKARQFGRDYQDAYLNMYGERVVWVLKELLGVQHIDDKLVDGAEVWSDFIFRGDDVDLLRRLADSSAPDEDEMERPWLLTFTEALAANERERALATLEARATAHAGTPKSAEKQAAAKEIMSSCGGEPEPLLDWARWLAGQPGPTSKELLAVLLVPAYPHERKQAVEWLQRLADDDNWEVREWAASAIGELANAHYDDWLPVLRDWVRHESQFVRRAVAVGAKYAVQKRRPGRCEELLDLIEPLVTDRAEEVRRNLGPFAIGGGFLGSCPDETLARVRRWASSDDEQSRWNAAMVFSAANARKHVDAGLEVLSGLASDQRRYVWMAVGAAARNLAKRGPDHVVPELERWLQDDRRLPAALALRGARRPSP